MEQGMLSERLRARFISFFSKAHSPDVECTFSVYSLLALSSSLGHFGWSRGVGELGESEAVDPRSRGGGTSGSSLGLRQGKCT
jgi:hypothetical protein